MKNVLLLLILLFLFDCASNTIVGGGTETVVGVIQPASNSTPVKSISLYSKNYNPITKIDKIFNAQIADSGHFSFPSIPHGEYVLHSYNEDSTYSSMTPIVVDDNPLTVEDTLREPGSMIMSLPGTPESGRIIFIRGTDISAPYSEGTIYEDSLTVILFEDIPPFTGLDLIIIDSNNVESVFKSNWFLLPGTYQVVDHFIIR